MGWSSSLGLGEILRTPCRKNLRYYETSLKASDLNLSNVFLKYLRKKIEQNEPDHQLFIYFKKAYDSVWREVFILFSLKWCSYDTRKINKNVTKRNVRV